ncbi:MAG: hypothetical protein ACO3AV_12460 [Ilumatobacteraceae bacterium]
MTDEQSASNDDTGDLRLARPTHAHTVTLMPRSLHDILQYSDDLASRFEQLDPDAMKAVPVEEYLLNRRDTALARGDAALIDAITRARLAIASARPAANGAECQPL